MKEGIIGVAKTVGTCAWGGFITAMGLINAATGAVIVFSAFCKDN